MKIFNQKLAIIGFGEAAGAITRGWQEAKITASVAAFDVKTDNPELAEQKYRDYADAGITGCTTCAEAVGNADVVFSLVTASEALGAARAVAPHIKRGAFFLDCNSCSPETKKKAERQISDAGGRYVDVAVMAPVYPKLHHVPLLVCGDHASDAVQVFQKLDMKASLVAGDVGRASSIKMVRSTMIKGLEALVLECFVAARAAGVEDDVLQSLEKSFPDFGWHDRAAYMMERAMTHGLRRAEEMREVASTIDDLGLPDDLARATTRWQQRIGELQLEAGSGDFRDHADQILARIRRIE